MSTMTKVFVVLTTVLTVALSCLFISASAQWDNYRELAQRYQTERDAERTHRENAQASAQASLALKDDALAERARELDQAKAEAKRLADEMAALKSEMAVVKNERLGFEAGRTKLQEILDVTTGELKSLQKQNQSLLAQNIDLQSRNARLNSRVLDLTTNVSILTDEGRHLQEKLYALEQSAANAPASGGGMRPASGAPSVRGATAARPAVASIRGTISAVDGVYASIDVGETSGVQPGMTFMVYRDGMYLCDLTVDSVRPQEAGGKLSSHATGSVKPGDSVSYGLN